MQASSRRVEDERHPSPWREEARPVFRSLSTGTRRSRRAVHIFLVASIAFHLVVLGLLSLHRRAASQTADVQVRVALVEPSALRPTAKETPPASRPPEKRAPARTTQPRQVPKPLLAPREIVPVTQSQPPAEEPEPDEPGEEDAGGEGSGVTSGHGGGSAPAMTAAPPPPPAAKPPAPIFENEVNVRRRRIAGHDPIYPPKAERNGIEGVVVAKVIIGPDGRVNDVIVIQTHPVFEATVRDAIAGWRFSPLVVNGKATTVYTIFRFTFKLS